MENSMSRKLKRSQWIWKNSLGFTLIEMMVTVAILGIAMFAIFELVVQQQRGYVMQGEITEIQQDIRIALDFMVSEIRMAGSGVPIGMVPICAPGGCTDSNPDTITVSFSTISTFLQPNGGVVGIEGGTPQVFVNSIGSFLNGQINIIRPLDKTVISTHNIQGIVIGPPAAIQIQNVPKAFVLGDVREGDMVVMQPTAVTYSVLNGALLRNGVILAQNIEDLQFSYINDFGIETDIPPIDPTTIRAVRVTIRSNTTREASQFLGADRTRQLSTVVKLRNLEG